MPTTGGLVKIQTHVAHICFCGATGQVINVRAWKVGEVESGVLSGDLWLESTNNSIS